MLSGFLLTTAVWTANSSASSASNNDEPIVAAAAVASHGAVRLPAKPEDSTTSSRNPATTAASAPTTAADPTTVPAPTTELTVAPDQSAITSSDEAVASTSATTDGASSTMPVGDLPGWRQIYTDDFTTNVALGSFPTAVSSKWGAYPSPWHDTSGYGTYTPGKVVSVAGGVLTKHIHTENNVRMVAAITPEVPGTSQNGLLYGRFAARFRSDSLPGYKVAWLLWPDSGDNIGDGEIDFPETNLDKASMWAFVHRTDAIGIDQSSFNVSSDMSAWHNVVIEWSPNLVVFLLDGVEVGRTSERVPATAMHWVLQTETAMDLTAAPSATVAGDVQLDWVAVWAYDASTADTTAPTVSYTTPGAGSTVSGSTVALAVDATDNKGVLGVQFKLNGVNLGPEDTTAPYETNWNTLLGANGSYTLTAVARDNAGNFGTSAARTVTVNNVADTTPPTFKPTPCLSGCTVFPQDGANVLAVFSENVVGVNGSTFTLRNKNTGALVTAVVSYAVSANAATATLNPSGVLLADTKYTATLTSGITDTSGNPLTTTSWTFLTGPRPTVSVSPGSGATAVSRTANVTATFSEPITGVSANFSLKTASGTAVTATVTYNSTTLTATLDPSTTLLANTQYTATLTSAIKDIAGNAINPTSWSFTTGP